MKRMHKTKRVLACVLALTMVLGLAACGGGSSTQNGGGVGTVSRSDYAYVPEFTALNFPDMTSLQALALHGDTIYFRFQPMDMWGNPEQPEQPTSMEEALRPWTGIASVQIDGTGLQVLWQGQGGQWENSDGSFGWHSEELTFTTLLPNGNLLATRTESTSGDNFEFNEQFFLMEIAPNGSVVREIDMIGQLNFSNNDIWSMTGLAGLSDGRVLLAMHEALVVLNENLGFSGRFPWEVSGFAVTANDQVLISQWGDNWTDINVRQFDIENGRVIETGDSLFDLHLHSARAGYLHDLYITTERGAFTFDFETGNVTQLFSWMDLDMLHGANIMPHSSGDLFYFDQPWEINAQASLVRLRRVEASSIPERVTLVYGALEVSWEMRNEIIEFNRRSQTHRIEIREYFDWMSGESREDAIRRLNTDMITGNAPDILEVTNLPFEAFARRGFLADLGAKIDADSSISRGDLVENVMHLLEIDGTLYTITAGFSIRTVIGQTERVGPNMGWTMEEFNRALEPVLRTGGSAFGNFVSQQSFLHSVLTTNMGQFIDRETGTVNFDSDLFRAYLEFASGLPREEELFPDWDTPGDWARPLPLVRAVAESTIEEAIAVDTAYIPIEPPIGNFPGDDWQSPHATGHTLLAEQTLWGFADLVWIEDMFQSPITFVGYPSEGGTGSVISPRAMLTISAQSAHQDVAWEFISSVLTEDFQRENTFAFPTNVNVLNQMAAIHMRNPETLTDAERWAGAWHELTQAQIDQVMALIQAADQLDSMDVTVIEMITEETLAFFAGDRSVEETTRIIQSRVQLYVSERG